MAILRSRGNQGDAVRIANPAVDRSILAWEQRVEAAEAAAYEQAKKELQQSYEQRIAAAEAAAKAAEESVDVRIAEVEAANRKRWEATLLSLSQATAEVEQLRSATVQAAEGEIVRLALAIAGQVLHREIQATDHGWLSDVLATALADVPARHGIVLRVHPDVAEVVEEHLASALQALADPPAKPRVELDSVLRPGSCRIECQGTVIDVGLPGAWARVAAHLLREAPSQDLNEVFTGSEDGPAAEL